MDPDECLRQLLAIAHSSVLGDDLGENDYMRMGELVEALDGWITKGGFLPARWKQAEPKPIMGCASCLFNDDGGDNRMCPGCQDFSHWRQGPGFYDIFAEIMKPKLSCTGCAAKPTYPNNAVCPSCTKHNRWHP